MPTSPWRPRQVHESRQTRDVPFGPNVINASNALFVTDKRRQAAQAIPPSACKHRLRAAARPPAQAAPDSGKVPPHLRNPSLMDYYTHLTDPGGMAGWVGHVGWLVADALSTKWSHGQPPV